MSDLPDELAPPPPNPVSGKNHPLIQALLDDMPDSGTEWPPAHYELWMRLWSLSIRYVYRNGDELLRREEAPSHDVLRRVPLGTTPPEGDHR